MAQEVISPPSSLDAITDLPYVRTAGNAVAATFRWTNKAKTSLEMQAVGNFTVFHKTGDELFDIVFPFVPSSVSFNSSGTNRITAYKCKNVSTKYSIKCEIQRSRSENYFGMILTSDPADDGWFFINTYLIVER